MSGMRWAPRSRGAAYFRAQSKIGDSLSVLPVMLELAKRHAHGFDIRGNFHPAVRSLVMPGALPQSFTGAEDVTYEISVKDAFDYGNIHHCHISAAHFVMMGMRPPALPVSLPLYAAPCLLPAGAVICPFTASDEAGSKFWPPERWRAVMDHLVMRRFIGRIYVIGASGDDFAPFGHPNAVHVIDMPLPQLLDLLRSAVVFVSVDSGPSHLAHFGGVSRHALLAPGHVSRELNRNPRGEIVSGHAAAVAVDEMIAAVDKVLSGP